jgi:hypothetical protein
MLTDQQVRRLRRFDRQGLSKGQAAAKAGMDDKTARKYRRLGKLPSEVRPMDRSWRTRPDPFADVWPQLEAQLALNPGLQANTLFAWLQRQYPGRFADGQLRTLQRHVKRWRALYGQAKEVFFAQVHHPGRLCASDFTHCTDLNITLAGASFAHLVYHFVLTYSNWETGTVCFAESFESLSAGLQNALWELGGVPAVHRTDCLTAAVPPGGDRQVFQQRYQALLRHYQLRGQAINPGEAHENGDAEQSHRQFKRALDQALLLRGSRDFANQAEYEAFLRQLFSQCNAGRQQRLAEERAVLQALPGQRLEACQRLRVRVDSGSTIHVRKNVYSVSSRLIGEWVEARLYAGHVEVWYGQRLVERLERLRGVGKHRVNYRHVIDWLVRKPGAFADYRYRDELFPSSHFRWAYDELCRQQPARAAKEYLQILYLAARQTEVGVEAVLADLLGTGKLPSAAAVEERLRFFDKAVSVTDVTVAAVDLTVYDALLGEQEARDGDERECERDTGGVSEGAAPAGVPGGLRGAGAAGAAGGSQLRALPAWSGGAGVPGAAEQADRAVAARVASAAGEELAGVGPEAVRSEGAAAGAGSAGGVVCGPSGERAGVRGAGIGQNASVMCDIAGVGAVGPQGAVRDLQPAGAGAAGGQAGPEAVAGAEAVGELRGAADR